ncbi:hypothetical protein DL95DRAFT_441266 [Leptodontidium sp. 2 PMI_412]|nr:hypothetical protein DL95DRAFT_441266 [Leptodontidium sp. 2 PMI_412]
MADQPRKRGVGLRPPGMTVENCPIASDYLLVGTKSSLAITSDSLVIHDRESDKCDERKFCSFPPSPGVVKIRTIPFYNILWAEVLQSELIIEYTSLSNEGVWPATIRYPVDPERQPVSKWITKLLDRSSGNCQQRRKRRC